jgi:hypothetical protein
VKRIVASLAVCAFVISFSIGCGSETKSTTVSKTSSPGGGGTTHMETKTEKPK